MAYRTLLVHLDTDARCGARLKVAAQMAQQHEAHVVGVAVGSAANSEALVHEFKLRMRSLDVASFDARTDQGDAPEVVARHAGCADLVILAQPGSDGTVAPDFVQRVFLRAGRPVLIVPDRGEL